MNSIGSNVSKAIKDLFQVYMYKKDVLVYTLCVYLMIPIWVYVSRILDKVPYS